MNPRHLIPAIGLLLWLSADGARALDDSPDRLPAGQRRLVAGLIQRGMPELVEELLEGAPTASRVYIARAYASAAVGEKTPEIRERMFNRAAEEYRRVIDLSSDDTWYRGERRELSVAQWRVELGDMILRYWCAVDLDQFEITSGLSFDADRLSRRLSEAESLYRSAGSVLEELDVGLRTNEREFLLLGIADQIQVLLEQERLNLAWTRLYLGMIAPSDSPDRTRLLSEALLVFDLASRQAEDADPKYQALLGSGIALRESNRLDEAFSALDLVVSSTAGLATTTRAEYELGRAYIVAGRYPEARRILDRLGAKSTKRMRGKNLSAAFYVRLAQLIHAYSFLHEARRFPPNDPRRSPLEQQAKSAFEALALKGGAWPRMVQVYLNSMAGAKRELRELTDVELAIAAGDLMNKNEYEKAEEAWRLLLGRPNAVSQHHEARFNLGVCLFQRQDVRGAAEVFLDEAKQGPPRAFAKRVYDYAFRCWRQIAADSRKPADFLMLAEAARLMADFGDGESADDVRWIVALALEEGGDYRNAAQAYARIPRQSPNYWISRRNVARCFQRVYESLDPTASADRRQRAAYEAVEAWMKFAQELERTEAPARDQDAPTLPATKRRQWTLDARLAACVLLSGNELREFRKALDLLEKLEMSTRVLGLRIRCLQGLGEIAEANRVLEDYLRENSASELGGDLLKLAAEMEAEVKRLIKVGRREDAKRMAIETLPTIRHLRDWIESRPEYSRHVRVVRFSLANMLILAERYDEAMREIDDLIARYPAEGDYLQAGARLQEKLALLAVPSDREDTYDKAEKYWERLLNDARLRDNAPAVYWEARYHWLRHQLRHGKATEVYKGIDSEKAWYPDLGGPPWQTMLLQLADEARAQAGATSP